MPIKDPRVEQNTKATNTLRELLRLIVSEPKAYADNDELLAALKSQGRTALLEIEFTNEKGTHTTSPMSLNTLKHYADELFDRGFDGLNDLRMGALNAILAFRESSKGSNKRTKEGLRKNVEELEYTLEEHRKINFILLQGLSEALGSIKSVRDAPDAKIRQNRANCIF
ncbi:MAG: hypothetical protein QX198_17725 [Methylococcaceae bacterium]